MELTRWANRPLVGGLLDDLWSPFVDRALLRPFEADVVEFGDEIHVVAELPGVKLEDLDLTLENNVLTISGEKVDEREGKAAEGRYHVMERRAGRFARSFALPRSVEQDNVRASFEDGVLTVRIPKEESGRRRRITIGAGNGPRRLSESTA